MTPIDPFPANAAPSTGTTGGALRLRNLFRPHIQTRSHQRVPAAVVLQRARLPLQSFPIRGRHFLHRRQILLQVIANAFLHHPVLRIAEQKNQLVRGGRRQYLVDRRWFPHVRRFQRVLQLSGARLQVAPRLDIPLGDLGSLDQPALFLTPEGFRTRGDFSACSSLLARGSRLRHASISALGISAALISPPFSLGVNFAVSA